MAAPRIEHLNMTLRDPEATARLVETVFGWQVRWDGETSGGGRTIHVGSENHYLALCTGPGGAGTAQSASKGLPLNHIGVEVEDLDVVEARVPAAGLAPFSHDNYEPGRRFYFKDANGVESKW